MCGRLLEVVAGAEGRSVGCQHDRANRVVFAQRRENLPPSAASMSSDKAFRASGRLSMTSATPSRSSRRTVAVASTSRAGRTSRHFRPCACAMSYYLIRSQAGRECCRGGPMDASALKMNKQEVTEFLEREFPQGWSSRSPNQIEAVGPGTARVRLTDRRPASPSRRNRIRAGDDGPVRRDDVRRDPCDHRPGRARSHDQPVDQLSPQAGARAI